MKKKKRLKKIEKLLIRAVGIALHGEYSNGVVMHGVDEGAARANECLDSIIDDASDLGIDIRSKIEMEGNKPDRGWVFTFHQQDNQVVFVAPKAFWEKYGFIPGDHIPFDVKLPPNWYECMEHALERAIDLKDKRTFRSVARKELTDFGFEEVKWKDGEFSRRIKKRIDLGDEWDPEEDGPDPLLEEEGKRWMEKYGKVSAR